MRSGRLRHKIEIQSRVVSTDFYGDEITSWATFGFVYADYEAETGREMLEKLAQEELTTGAGTWKIRYKSGVTAGMRVVFRERTWDIHSVANMGERNREMHLVCTEIA